jgi:hypothetical protein
MWRLGFAVLAGVVLMWFGPQRVVAQSPDFAVRVGLYMQAQLEASSLGTAEDGRVLMRMRRARPRFEVQLNDWISARVEPDFGQNDAELRYGYIELAVGDEVDVTIGQFKKPFGLVQSTSSSRIPVIERATEIAGLEARIEDRSDPVRLPDGQALTADEQALLDAFGYQGYAIGAAIRGEAGRLGWEAGVFEGPTGRRDDGGRRGGAAARATFEAAPGLRLGAAVSHSRLSFDEVTRDGTVGGVDLALNEPGEPGPGFLAEAVFGRGAGSGTDIAGAHVITWLHQPLRGRFTAVEPVLRASFGDSDVDTADDAGMLLTGGLNVYMGGRNRLMVNWDVYASQDERVGTESALRAQAQVYF